MARDRKVARGKTVQSAASSKRSSQKSPLKPRAAAKKPASKSLQKTKAASKLTTVKGKAAKPKVTVATKATSAKSPAGKSTSTKTTVSKLKPSAGTKTTVVTKATTQPASKSSVKTTTKATTATRMISSKIASKPTVTTKAARRTSPLARKKPSRPAASPVAAVTTLADGSQVLAEGRRLRLVTRKGWEFARRVNVTGVVGIVALNSHQQLILVEQYREPMKRQVIELPAGLAGDIAGQEHEQLVTAAQRELEEETGYRARSWQLLNEGPSSAGLTDETVCLYLAQDCIRINAGGGDGSEDIIVHEVSLPDLPHWLREQNASGKLIDHKIYAGLYFLQQQVLTVPMNESGIALVEPESTPAHVAVAPHVCLVNPIPADEIQTVTGYAPPMAMRTAPPLSTVPEPIRPRSDDVPLEESLSLPLDGDD